MKQPHILLIPSWYPTPHNQIAGVFFQEQARALHEIGAQVGVIYPDLRTLRQFSLSALRHQYFQLTKVEQSVKQFTIQGWNLVPRGPLNGASWRLVAKILAQEYVKKHGLPDVLHAHSAMWGGYAALSLSQSLRIPYVITEHSSSYGRGLIKPWQKRRVRRIFENAAAVIAVSNPFATILREHVVPEIEFTVIPNMVDTDFFTLPKLPRAASKPFVYLSIARLDQNKGIDSLVKAFCHVFRGDNQFQLYIGGDGPDRAFLDKLVTALGLQSQVKFLGQLSREQVRGAMHNAHVFVLPSFSETFGVVLIEAMSTGLPVIATRCGGPEDIVVPSVGLLVSPGDIEQLGLALLNITDKYLLYDQNRIRNYASRSYGKRHVTARLLEIYDSVRRNSMEAPSPEEW